MLSMIAVDVTVSIPAGEFCDICTPESIENIEEKQTDGSIRIIPNKVQGIWEYRCPFAGHEKPRSKCYLFNRVLKEAETKRGDPIAHRLIKCKQCLAAPIKANK